MPPPEPRSSTVSPSRSSATAVGIAAAERRERGRLGQLGALLDVVERLAERSSRPLRSSSRCRIRSSRCPCSRPGRTPRTASGPPRAAHRSSWTSAARSFQVGDGREGLDGVALEGEERPAAPLLALDEPGVDELLHVMRDGRLREPERLGEVADADGLAGVRREQVHDPHARRVAEGAEELRSRAGLVVAERGRRERGAADDRLDGGARRYSIDIRLSYRRLSIDARRHS